MGRLPDKFRDYTVCKPTSDKNKFAKQIFNFLKSNEKHLPQGKVFLLNRIKHNMEGPYIDNEKKEKLYIFHLYELKNILESVAPKGYKFKRKYGKYGFYKN